MLKRLLSGFILFTLTTMAYTATDPIQWSLSGSFPNPANSTHSTVTYTFTNKIPFTLVKPILITKSASPSTEFTYVDTCSGHKLTPNQSCTVAVTLSPSTTGNKSVTLTIEGYDNNRVPLPTLTTSTTSSGPAVTVTTTTPLPSSVDTGSSAPWEFTFTNNGAATATGIAITSNQSSFSTTCTVASSNPRVPPTGTLLSGASCTVSGTFTPTSATPSTQVVTATFTYTQSTTAVTGTTSTTVINATGITGALTVGLPSLTTTTQSYPATFTFTNHDATDYTVKNANSFPVQFVVSGSSTCPSPLVVGGTGTLAAHTSCTYTGTFTPTAATTYTLTSSLTYGSPPPGSPTSVTTSTTAQVAGAGDRTFTFFNHGYFNVWFSLTGGAIANSPTCPASACPLGTTCNTAAQLCYFNNYGPTNNTFLLTPGLSNTVIIPVPPTNSQAPDTQWSGVASASLNCNGSTSCQEADCSNAGGSASCAVGVGFGQPATQAEFTLLKQHQDSYDVEVINGFHLPIEMTPVGGQPTSGYFCGIPGNPSATVDFGACNWNNAVPASPSTSYYWVTSGVATCSSGGTCSGNLLCGLDIGINQVCGSFLGYWSADNACAVNATKAQPLFGCTNYLANPPFPTNTYTMKELYGCVPQSSTILTSCYSAGATAECCGCANWGTIPGITLPATTASCVNTNDTVWTGSVQRTLQWIKAACPNYYTYPFDDASSNFACTSNAVQPGLNATNYTITFCPGGNTGLPSGKSEGRCGTGGACP